MQDSLTHFVKGVVIVSDLNLRAQSLRLNLNDLNVLTYDYSSSQILLGQEDC